LQIAISAAPAAFVLGVACRKNREKLSGTFLCPAPGTGTSGAIAVGMLNYMAAFGLGGSVAILVAAGILSLLTFVSEERRKKLSNFSDRAERSLQRRITARRAA
jgi:hypothetical protein